MSQHRAYRQWRMQCEKCKGRFNYRCWNYEVPLKCACTGTLHELKDDTESTNWYLQDRGYTPYVVPVVEPKITSNDPDVILRDLEDLRWSEHLGG